MFYVGQKVVCIEPIAGELVKGQEYIIDGIFKCDKCDFMGISVGIISDNITHNIFCGNIRHVRKSTAHESMYEYYRASRFAPLETYRESYSIAIQLVQELEQVDKAKITKKETVKN